MRRKSLAAVILAFTGLIGSMIWSFLPSPLPPPTPWSAALPVASPPPSMAIFQLPTGTYQTPAALAFRGGSFFETRDFASTAVLVRTPRATSCSTRASAPLSMLTLLRCRGSNAPPTIGVKAYELSLPPSDTTSAHCGVS